MKYVKPLKFKSLVLPSNVLYSPLAGCSDFPFRQMAALYPVGLMYCEMVKMDALIRHDQNTYHILDYRDSMRPIGAQLCGSKLNYAGPTARIIEELGFDVVDLNCGCPVDKVTKDGSGSGMLKNPNMIGDIIANMVAAVDIPVTVKIRTGWDDDNLNAPEITRIAEEAGATAIAIHGRTRAQKYTGRADRNIIRECKQVANDIIVIGNGDVFTAQDGIDLFEQTGCDAILASRGTMGQPWIAEDVKRLDNGETLFLVDGDMIRDHLLKHIDFIRLYQTKRKAMLDTRRVGCWFLRMGKGTKKLRESINKSKSLDEMILMIKDYDWSQTKEFSLAK